MSTNLSHPKEIDLVPKEMEKPNIKPEAPVSESKHPNRVAQDGWQGASNSAYRSAYLKLHFDDL
jgi:uncharacterized protein YukE